MKKIRGQKSRATVPLSRTLTLRFYEQLRFSLKRECHQIFAAVFHQKTSPDPKSHAEKRFRSLSDIRGLPVEITTGEWRLTL
jgi:hypothetical protein